MTRKVNCNRSIQGDRSRAEHVQSPKAAKVVSLSAIEEETLSRCEAVIKAPLSSFFAVGEALLKIHLGYLYRAQYHSFEDYCRNHFHMSRIHAFRLVRAAKLYQLLSTIGDVPLPQNEAQIRPLAELSENKAKTIWRKAVARAGSSKVTAKLVQVLIAEEKGYREIIRSAEWQNQVSLLLNKIRIETKRGDVHKVSSLLEKMRIVLDIEIARETWSKQ
jgi:hypothetical protein